MFKIWIYRHRADFGYITKNECLNPNPNKAQTFSPKDKNEWNAMMALLHGNTKPGEYSTLVRL